MKIYLVGGAVRDKLLGLPIKERDWVVVGATPNDLINLGYKQVGKEFPVFLHPHTNEEYALARMERKVKPGYAGFTFDTSPGVSLEEDLQRRDLTINAMASTEAGDIIDPYHGQADLKQRLLRHVSPAFSEDPVRILRIGRFLARFAHLGFHVAPETITLMRQMTAAGEVNALVAERVWKELERALSEKNPEKFFEVLMECNAYPILFPPLAIPALTIAGQQEASTLARFAVLFHALDKTTITEFAKRYRIPTHYEQLAVLVATHHQTALQANKLSAGELLQLFSALDIFRRSERFNAFLEACTILANNQPFDATWLQACAMAAKSYPVQTLLQQGFEGIALAAMLKTKRIETLTDWLQKHPFIKQ